MVRVKRQAKVVERGARPRGPRPRPDRRESVVGGRLGPTGRTSCRRALVGGVRGDGVDVSPSLGVYRLGCRPARTASSDSVEVVEDRVGHRVREKQGVGQLGRCKGAGRAPMQREYAQSNSTDRWREGEHRGRTGRDCLCGEPGPAGTVHGQIRDQHRASQVVSVDTRAGADGGRQILQPKAQRVGGVDDRTPAIGAGVRATGPSSVPPKTRTRAPVAITTETHRSQIPRSLAAASSATPSKASRCSRRPALTTPTPSPSSSHDNGVRLRGPLHPPQYRGRARGIPMHRSPTQVPEQAEPAGAADRQ